MVVTLTDTCPLDEAFGSFVSLPLACLSNLPASPASSAAFGISPIQIQEAVSLPEFSKIWSTEGGGYCLSRQGGTLAGLSSLAEGSIACQRDIFFVPAIRPLSKSSAHSSASG